MEFDSAPKKLPPVLSVLGGKTTKDNMNQEKRALDYQKILAITGEICSLLTKVAGLLLILEQFK